MSKKILVVDDDQKIRKLCSVALGNAGYEVSFAGDAAEALRIADKKPFDLALIDIKMPETDGLELLQLLKEKHENLVVIMITGFPSIETSVKAIKSGAYDYVTKPFLPGEIRFAVEKALEYNNTLNKNLELKQALKKNRDSIELIGDSPKIQQIFDIIESMGDMDCTVLIEGENGTGKEVLARTIHKYSKRYDKQFIAINCGALPETLLESELFGYEKGAFSGAVGKKRGLVELANGGVLFLDEVAETSNAFQVKLLRILEERAVRRLGSTTTKNVDFRLLAATNKNLLKEVKKGNFRMDLYYRLNVISISLPPLRERTQDIPRLLDHFVRRFNIQHSKEINGFSDKALELLLMYDFPGNVRELSNIVERAVIISKNKTIQKEFIPCIIGKEDLDVKEDSFRIDITEKKHIERVLEFTKGQKSRAAELLGIDRKTLYLKLKKCDIANKYNGN